MLEQIPASPPDAILGLNEAFQLDSRPEKVNLTVGVYVDSDGKTPILRCVKSAETRVHQQEESKTYLNMAGHPLFRKHVQGLLFDGRSTPVNRELAVTLQTPGGTGALRVVADFIHAHFPKKTTWISRPTWANHPKIFAAGGVATDYYPYADLTKQQLDLDAMLASLEQIPEGDFVILHGCCHNPTGIDPDRAEWTEIAKRLASRGLIPILDFAYQGFGIGLNEDAVGLDVLLAELNEIIICSSFSKTFGLYRERVGALTVVTTDESSAGNVLAAMKTCVRRNYSNPPAHGAQIVAEILGDAELRQQWVEELKTMSGRIQQSRKNLSAALQEAIPDHDFSYLTQQIGMFSTLPLDPEQVEELREAHAIYMVGNGRINLAGLQSETLPYVVDKVRQVLVG